MGGATSSTSKIMIVHAPKDKSKYDISYLFGHPSVDKNIIDYSANCENLSDGVPFFIIQEKLIKLYKD